MVCCVDSRGHHKSGVPGPTVFVVGFVQVNIQVDPFSLRRNFKLSIVFDIMKIGTNEPLRHIPVPALICLSGNNSRGFHMEFVIGTDKQEVQIVFSPAGANFGTEAWYGCPLFVLFKIDRACCTPKRRSWVCLQRNISAGLNGFNGGFVRGLSRGYSA